MLLLILVVIFAVAILVLFPIPSLRPIAIGILLVSVFCLFFIGIGIFLNIGFDIWEYMRATSFLG